MVGEQASHGTLRQLFPVEEDRGGTRGNGGGEVYRRREKRGWETGYLTGCEPGEIENKFCLMFLNGKSTQRNR